MPCGPENVDKLLKAADAEIDSIKAFGPDVKNLDKVKKTWLEQYKVQLKENSFWSAKLQSILFEGADPQRIFDYEKNVNALTTDDIKAAANLLFDGKNVLQAVLVGTGYSGGGGIALQGNSVSLSGNGISGVLLLEKSFI